MKLEYVFRAVALTVAIGLVLASTAAVRADRIIDPFDADQNLVANQNNTSASGSVKDVGILGMERDAVVDWDNGALDVQFIADANNNSLLNFNTGADTMGTAMLTWDGPDSDASTLDTYGLGGVDLTEGGLVDRFAVNVKSADLPATLAFTVYSGHMSEQNDSGQAMGYAELAVPQTIGNPTTYHLVFTDFIGTKSVVDFTDVGAITMEIIPTYQATDLQLDFVKTETPEPTTVCLLALGAISLFNRRK